MTVLTALPSVVVRAAQQADDGSVSPGVLGFLVTFAVVLACIPLFRSMTGKIRGVQYRGTIGADEGSSTRAGAGAGAGANGGAGAGDGVAAPTVPAAGHDELRDDGSGTGPAHDEAPEGPGRSTPEA